MTPLAPHLSTSFWLILESSWVILSHWLSWLVRGLGKTVQWIPGQILLHFEPSHLSVGQLTGKLGFSASHWLSQPIRGLEKSDMPSGFWPLTLVCRVGGVLGESKVKWKFPFVILYFHSSIHRNVCMNGTEGSEFWLWWNEGSVVQLESERAIVNYQWLIWHQGVIFHK